jgi:predicted ribosome quality control (RQC) complex YloA/Tae2 family protein
VHFSKQAEATRADVHVAAIRDVSKPKRAKPGLVHVHRGRTVHLRRDPARLARILAARIED